MDPKELNLKNYLLCFTKTISTGHFIDFPDERGVYSAMLSVTMIPASISQGTLFVSIDKTARYEACPPNLHDYVEGEKRWEWNKYATVSKWRVFDPCEVSRRSTTSTVMRDLVTRVNAAKGSLSPILVSGNLVRDHTVLRRAFEECDLTISWPFVPYGLDLNLLAMASDALSVRGELSIPLSADGCVETFAEGLGLGIERLSGIVF